MCVKPYRGKLHPRFSGRIFDYGGQAVVATVELLQVTGLKRAFDFCKNTHWVPSDQRLEFPVFVFFSLFQVRGFYMTFLMFSIAAPSSP